MARPLRRRVYRRSGSSSADEVFFLARGYQGGTDLSGGQWQRIALARALSPSDSAPGVVLLDEPTAQLGRSREAEIFDRLLTATRIAPPS